MKPKLILGITLSGLLFYSCANIAKNSEKTEFEQANEIESEIFYADPTIFTENGKYYLTGTRNYSPQGFILLESDDLINWKMQPNDSLILEQGKNVFGNKGFWAPQILKNDNEYFITYTADEQTVLAKSKNLMGKYNQEVISAIDNSEKNIDSFLFKDDDGKWYLYHVRFNHGNFLWVGEFDPTTGKIIDGTLTQCFKNDQDWECTPSYPFDPIMEGPTVIKKDGLYYLFYSANHFMSPDYAVGYAVAETPYGPWKKNPDNPIISKDIVGEKGSGHGDFFIDNEGQYRYVYHVHYSDSIVSPRKTRIINLNFGKQPGDKQYHISVDKNSIIKPKLKF